MASQNKKSEIVDSTKIFSEEDVKAMFPDMDMKVYHKEKGQVTHLVCAGLDVHKSFIVSCVCITDPSTFLPSYYVNKFLTVNASLIQMEDWMRKLGVVDVCMESTGKYSLPIYRHLEEAGFKPVIVNPKYVLQVKGQKTDERDAIHIANIFRMGMVKPSIIPTYELQDIRDLSRARKKLVEDQTREKNRLQNALETSGIRLGSVLDDVFGKTGRSIVEYLITTPKELVRDEAILKLVDPRCRADRQAILDSIHGYTMSPYKMGLMEVYLEHLDVLASYIKKIDELIGKAIAPYAKQLRLLEHVPAISHVASVCIIAEVGVDMSRWTGPDQFISWNGLCPANNASAKKNKSTKIGPGGYWLKPIILQCALSAVKMKDGYYRNKYLAISKRRGKKKALIAIARMMMRSIYFVLRDEVEWHPKDLEKLSAKKDEADKLATKQQIEDACAVLRRSGVSEDILKQVIEQCDNAAMAS